jgi:hypothetical protein
MKPSPSTCLLCASVPKSFKSLNTYQTIKSTCQVPRFKRPALIGMVSEHPIIDDFTCAASTKHHHQRENDIRGTWEVRPIEYSKQLGTRYFGETKEENADIHLCNMPRPGIQNWTYQRFCIQLLQATRKEGKVGCLEGVRCMQVTRHIIKSLIKMPILVSLQRTSSQPYIQMRISSALECQ